jgi:hypothetical protein
VVPRRKPMRKLPVSSARRADTAEDRTARHHRFCTSSNDARPLTSRMPLRSGTRFCSVAQRISLSTALRRPTSSLIVSNSPLRVNDPARVQAPCGLEHPLRGPQVVGQFHDHRGRHPHMSGGRWPVWKLQSWFAVQLARMLPVNSWSAAGSRPATPSLTIRTRWWCKNCVRFRCRAETLRVRDLRRGRCRC